MEDQDSKAFGPDDVTTATEPNLSILEVRSGALPLGQIYTFTLSASQPDSGHQGSASMTLLTSLPPYGGLCDLTPESDIHLLETTVTYNCTGEKVILSLLVKCVHISSKGLFYYDLFYCVAGWRANENTASQLIYTFQVAPCLSNNTVCPVLTLYR